MNYNFCWDLDQIEVSDGSNNSVEIEDSVPVVGFVPPTVSNRMPNISEKLMKALKFS